MLSDVTSGPWSVPASQQKILLLPLDGPFYYTRAVIVAIIIFVVITVLFRSKLLAAFPAGENLKKETC